MTRTTRIKVGGWAALIAAVAIPFEVAALLSATGPVDQRLTSPFLAAAEAVRVLGLLVAAIALSGWLHDIDPRLAPVASFAGIAGSGLALLADAAVLLDLPSNDFAPVVFVLVNAGIGCWFILAGSIITRAGDEYRRVGSVGQLGGAGWLLASVGSLLFSQLPVEAGGGPWLVPYALILSLFGVLFLVRLWQAVALGRYPGPGVI